jgi:hypothetical protein
MLRLNGSSRPLLLFALLLSGATPSWSQQPDLDARRGLATRQELQGLLTLYERSAESTAYSDSLRAKSRLEAGLIRERLERGDFQVGDRIILSVEREPSLNETFVVSEGPALRLPLIRQLSLVGVLRSELEGHLRTQISRFLEDPQVRTQSLVRISIMGAVGRPGFYPAPSETLLSDALNLAGGPNPGARIDQITVERDGQRIWSGDDIRQAIVDGKTLDQLDIRPGDRFKVPNKGGGMFAAEGAFRWLSILTSVPLTIFTLSNIF